MKKIISLIAVIGCVCLSAHAGNYTTLLNGNLYTNVNVALNSGTNTAGVVTNNFQLGQIPGASNIVFTLNSGTGVQPFLGTNALLPSAGFSPQGNYPNTLYGPYNNTEFYFGGNLMATNATSTAVVFRFAGSVDGVLWATNVFVFTYTIPINSLTPANQFNSVLTNFQAGALPYMCLQEIENPGVSALTNIVIQTSGKPGL